MYRSLNAVSLGINARQNELIELALTYGFEAFDIDAESFLRQATTRGTEHAARFVQSASIKVACFDLPVQLAASDPAYQADIAKLQESAPSLQQLGAQIAVANITPYGVDRAYHEDFELHRERLFQIGGLLEPFGIRVALNFLAPSYHRESHPQQFICTPDALLTLHQTVGHANVALCLDFWHWHVAGGTPDLARDLAADQIAVVRVADLPREAELDTITEQSRLLPSSTGVVPLPAWFEWLRGIDYPGPVTAMCGPEKSTGGKRHLFVDQVARSLGELIQGKTPPISAADEEEGIPSDDEADADASAVSSVS